MAKSPKITAEQFVQTYGREVAEKLLNRYHARQTNKAEKAEWEEFQAFKAAKAAAKAA